MRQRVKDLVAGSGLRTAGKWGGLCATAAFAVYNGALGAVHGSLWHGSICLYYILLAALRGTLLTAERREERGIVSARRKRGLFYGSWGLMLVMNVTLTVPAALMVQSRRPVSMGMIPAITSATYATYKLAAAALGLREKGENGLHPGAWGAAAGGRPGVRVGIAEHSHHRGGRGGEGGDGSPVRRQQRGDLSADLWGYPPLVLEGEKEPVKGIERTAPTGRPSLSFYERRNASINWEPSATGSWSMSSQWTSLSFLNQLTWRLAKRLMARPSSSMRASSVGISPVR